ncbi:MAG: cupin domain-containing protein [Anaerolineales bacterium]|nr:cupin domain-containing protein [Anaerolineales bacterium]
MLQKVTPDYMLQEEKIPSLKKVEANLVSEHVGRQLHAMRKARRLSIRSLAEISGLSVNTLSLIENGKTSPSVNTLSQLAQSLNVPIPAFFETKHKRQIAYQKAGERKQIVFAQGQLENLSEGMPHMGSEPFIMRLEPNASSGAEPIIYGGREFIYCLEGHITYTIEGETYPLAPGDSLIFDSYTPHFWRNTAPTSSRALLVLCPENVSEELPEHYFVPVGCQK